MWYYCVNGKVDGPVDDKQLKALAEQGVFTPVDQVNKQGTTTWIDAGKVKNLFPSEVVMLHVAQRDKREQRLKTFNEFVRYVLAFLAVLAITYVMYNSIR